MSGEKTAHSNLLSSQYRIRFHQIQHKTDLQMKVLFVINNFYGKGNGLQSSARRTVHYLKKEGVDVRILSMQNPDPDGPRTDYVLEKFHLPVFQWILDSQSYCFAKRDRKVIEEAVRWADVIHLEEGFILECEAANIAKKVGTAVVGTFHLHPENIFATIHMGWSRFLNHGYLGYMRERVFNKCSDIQCPTMNVLERLQRFHFKSELHFIPNGAILDQPVLPDAPREPKTDPYILLCVGRLSVEKDQPTLMRAMKYSKYADKIQINFAGKGPQEHNLKKMADEYVKKGILKYPPVFGFHTLNQLRNMAREAYLYIHCATIEVEGLSCIEVIREGTVPVIATSPLTATPQFAIDGHSLFPARNARALAEKIDWWIEHPDYRRKMSHKYSASVEKYDINKSIESLIAMYRNAINKLEKK